MDSARSTVARYDPSAQPYVLLKQGVEAIRTDAESGDGINYQSFDPPTSWEAPHSVQRVTFTPNEKQKYMHHRGEELIIPTDGEVMYHFYFYPEGKLGSAPSRQYLPRPLSPQTITRINPQIPHHSWAHGNSNALAWMIFRDASQVARSISTIADFLPDEARLRHHPRLVSEDDLNNPAHRALILWGISQRVRLQRDLLGMTIADTAKATGISASQLSKLEDGTTNIPLLALETLAAYLGINLASMIRPPTWAHMTEDFVDAAGNTRNSYYACAPPPDRQSHLLHPSIWFLERNSTRTLIGGAATEELQNVSRLIQRKYLYYTWIVLSGEIIAEITLGLESPAQKELMQEGYVLHLDAACNLTMSALTDASLLQVCVSSVCSCKEREYQIFTEIQNAR